MYLIKTILFIFKIILTLHKTSISSSIIPLLSSAFLLFFITIFHRLFIKARHLFIRNAIIRLRSIRAIVSKVRFSA